MTPMDRSDRFLTRDPIPSVDRVIAPGPGGSYRGEYEIRVLDFTRDVTRAEMRRRLTEDAEYGQWELLRTRIYQGGRRRSWMRRKIIRVR